MSLRICGLAVDRGGARVLRDIDLDIAPGGFVGLVGSNGSGKSTLLSAIAGVLPIASGSIRIEGHAAGTADAARRIGRAIDPALLPTGLSGRQVLELVANARQGGRSLPEPARALCAALELERFLDLPIAACSLGTRQKIGIVAGLVDEPAWWLLDESLNGLDPPSAWVLKQHLVAARARGITTLLATHGLEIAETMLSRVIVLEGGQVRADWDEATLDRLRADPAQGVEAALVATMRPSVTAAG